MSPEFEELLQEARAEERRLAPTLSDRQRVRQRLGVALGGGAVLATTGAVSKAAVVEGAALVGATADAGVGTLGGASFLSGVSGLKLAGWLLVGSALGLGGAWTSRGLLGAEVRPVAAPVARRPPVEGQRSAPALEPAASKPDSGQGGSGQGSSGQGSAVQSPLEERAASPSLTGSASVRSRGGAAASRERPEGTQSSAAPASGAENILEESKRLRAAQLALARGDLAAAQRELDGASGTLLLPERLGLGAITACRRGDVALARSLQSQVLARFPNAPIVPRLRRELAAACPRAGNTSTDPDSKSH